MDLSFWKARFLGLFVRLWQGALRPLHPLYRAALLWDEADGMRMSAAMSFYGILSLAPLLVLLVALLGWWVDRELLTHGLVSQIGTLVGEQGAAVIQQALSSAREPAQGLVASAAGLVILLFGATGVFGELQSALERLWHQGRTTTPDQAWWYSAGSSKSPWNGRQLSAIHSDSTAAHSLPKPGNGARLGKRGWGPWNGSSSTLVRSC